MKRLALIALLLLTLTGCSNVGKALERNWEFDRVMKDGRTVTCIAWKLGYAGGLSCDWENAK